MDMVFPPIQPSSACPGIAVRRTAFFQNAYVPGIHDFSHPSKEDVDGRVKPGHDDGGDVTPRPL
jgi:hypothetical protein